MWQAIWTGLAVCAVGAGCVGPQFYTPPPEQVPPPATVGGATVQIVDQRPEWEKKPFTGVVCLYHLGKAHPDAWAQLAEEANAVVAAMPEKPQRVEVAVTSFRLVRSVENTEKFRDFGPVPVANPGARTQQMVRANGDAREQSLARANGGAGAPAPYSNISGPGNRVEMALSSKDDPRRLLQDHPSGASCAIQATVRLVFPGGREQSVDVKTMNRGDNSTGTAYMGEAMDAAARTAVIQFGRQFRSGVGLNPDS